MKINSLPEQKVLIDCYQVSAFGFDRYSSLYVTDVDSGQLVHKLHFKKDEQLYSMARLNNWQVLCISASSDMTSYTIYVLTLPKFTFEELYCITDIVSELEYEVAFPYAVFPCPANPSAASRISRKPCCSSGLFHPVTDDGRDTLRPQAP